MHRGFGAAVAAGVGVLSLVCASQTLANVTVIGGGLAEACSKNAKAAAGKGRPHAESLHVCTVAIEQELLNTHDLAGTYVNRGVIRLTMADYGLAQRDFDLAAQIEPELGEAYVNRGAALIAQGKDAEGIADIDKGLSLMTEEPEKAYFNRAIAKERLGDVKGAYFDYRKALELKPNWDMAQAELQRFTVVQPGAQ